MWHSKWLCYQWMVSIRSLRPQQPGKDKNRAGSMAMWVAPIRMYNHLSREIHFTSLIYFDVVPFRETVVWAQPLVIYIRYTQAKWVVGHVWPGCKMFLLNPVYSPLEIHFRQVVPYLVKVGIQSPISAREFDLYTIYVEREMQAFY